jgi:hypothetical protein
MPTPVHHNPTTARPVSSNPLVALFLNHTPTLSPTQSTPGLDGVVHGALNAADGDGNNTENGDGKGGRERGWSSLSDPFFTSSPTLSSFYAAVADQYYHLEPTVYRVNFELTDAQVHHTQYLGP